MSKLISNNIGCYFFQRYDAYEALHGNVIRKVFIASDDTVTFKTAEQRLVITYFYDTILLIDAKDCSAFDIDENIRKMNIMLYSHSYSPQGSWTDMECTCMLFTFKNGVPLMR